MFQNGQTLTCLSQFPYNMYGPRLQDSHADTVDYAWGLRGVLEATNPVFRKQNPMLFLLGLSQSRQLYQKSGGCPYDSRDYAGLMNHRLRTTSPTDTNDNIGENRSGSPRGLTAFTTEQREAFNCCASGIGESLDVEIVVAARARATAMQTAGVSDVTCRELNRFHGPLPSSWKVRKEEELTPKILRIFALLGNW